MVELVALSESTVLLANGGETTSLTVLVHGRGDPVDLGVTADLFNKIRVAQVNFRST